MRSCDLAELYKVITEQGIYFRLLFTFNKLNYQQDVKGNRFLNSWEFLCPRVVIANIR